MSGGRDLLAALAGNGPITMPVALVVAHPDDESIAAAGSLVRLRALTLIHVTNGVAGGQENGEAYGATRRAELNAALRAAQAAPLRHIHYDIPDQAVRGRLPQLIRMLAIDLQTVDAVITHPYEGGHIDHDACAEAVATACAHLRALTGTAPGIVEFASYFFAGGDVRASAFRGGEDGVTRIALSESAIRRRDAAFACHASQRDNLRYFTRAEEAFRIAPAYVPPSGHRFWPPYPAHPERDTLP
jgi:LmbE family N-acetylglucosaminyl deacetylase